MAESWQKIDAGDLRPGDLLLAARDMYDALDALVRSDMAMREEEDGRVSSELQAARAALRKARGENTG